MVWYYKFKNESVFLKVQAFCRSFFAAVLLTFIMLKTWKFFQTRHLLTAFINFDAKLTVTYWFKGPTLGTNTHPNL